MEVIAAMFSSDLRATAARGDLMKTLKVDADLVTLDHLPATAGDHAGEPLLVVWITEANRAAARDVIGRHDGHHVPFDWTHAVQEEVVAESLPDIATGVQTD